MTNQERNQEARTVRRRAEDNLSDAKRKLHDAAIIDMENTLFGDVMIHVDKIVALGDGPPRNVLIELLAHLAERSFQHGTLYCNLLGDPATESISLFSLALEELSK